MTHVEGPIDDTVLDRATSEETTIFFTCPNRMCYWRLSQHRRTTSGSYITRAHQFVSPSCEKCKVAYGSPDVMRWKSQGFETGSATAEGAASVLEESEGDLLKLGYIQVTSKEAPFYRLPKHDLLGEWWNRPRSKEDCPHAHRGAFTCRASNHNVCGGCFGYTYGLPSCRWNCDACTSENNPNCWCGCWSCAAHEPTTHIHTSL